MRLSPHDLIKDRNQHMSASSALRSTGHAAEEDFASLLDETLGRDSGFDGSVVSGRVLRVTDDAVIVDVGLKSEGRVPLKEFAAPGQKPEVAVGDVVELYVERYEDRDGSIVLSREKARREESWSNLEKAHAANQRVNGTIYSRVKGGFTVDLGGAVAFLPGSQVDIRPVRDVGPLMGTPQPFQILKMDRARGNIVVSRRAVLEETRAEQRSELIQGLKEGMILDGVVKNITDYGAFVDLGGVDGLLHVTDIAWRRINHPSEALQIGQPVKVQVIRFNQETQRISLGMKQLEVDPWEGVAAKYPPAGKFSGRVTNITDYGAFVELEPGVEGLVHVSEMSWTKKNVHPGKIVATSQEVEVLVLDVDASKRRISLGLKQVQRNPWEQFIEEHPVGSVIEGEIRNITEFGLFIGIGPEIDGMAHMSDLSWDETGEQAITHFNKGDVIKAKVLDVDVEKERISLGVKQLREDPAAGVFDRVHKGDIVTCVVTAVQANGIEVQVDEVLTGFIRRAELARDKADQRPDRFAVGEKVDAKIISVDRAARKLALTIRGKEMDEDKQAVQEYGSADSGASLGDILGAAIRRRNQQSDV
jgi:small subunit ribosomal protein S1